MNCIMAKLRCFTFVIIIYNLVLQSNGQVNPKYAQDYMFGFDREPQKQAPQAPKRLLQLMKVHVADTRLRVRGLNNIRFKNEDTYEYQTGYVMATIIEKYRLMMEHHQRPKRYPSDPVFECLKRTELIQQLYIEIWHLCMMLHEIRRKTVVKSGLGFNSDNEDENVNTETVESQKLKDLEEARKQAKRIAKKRRIEARMINNLYKKYFNKAGVRTGWGKRMTAKAFELNYGWDLAYQPGHGPRLVFSTVVPTPEPLDNSMMGKAKRVLEWIKDLLLHPEKIKDQMDKIRKAIKYLKFLHSWGLLSSATLKEVLWIAVS